MPAADGAVGIARQFYHNAVDDMRFNGAVVEAHVAGSGGSTRPLSDRRPFSRPPPYARTPFRRLARNRRYRPLALRRAQSPRARHKTPSADSHAVLAHGATPFSSSTRAPATSAACPLRHRLVSAVKVLYSSMTVNHFNYPILSMKKSVRSPAACAHRPWKCWTKRRPRQHTRFEADAS